MPFYAYSTTYSHYYFRRYRFRLIGAASRCYFLLMVDGHQMTVITTDGMPIVPVTVGSLVLQPGWIFVVITIK